MASHHVSISNATLVELPPEYLGEAADLAANALIDNPIYTAICGPANQSTTAADDDDGPSRSFRQRFLSWIFEKNFRLRSGTCVNRALFDGSNNDKKKNKQLVAFFMFLPPNTPDVGLLDMLRVGMAAAPFLFGIDVVRRLLSIKDEYERIERIVVADHRHHRHHRHDNNVPMYRLERMVVRTEMQGRGIGSRALREALRESDAAGLPVLLSTQEERNVRFYGRLGFEVVKEDEIAGHTSWSMIRQPVASDED